MNMNAFCGLYVITDERLPFETMFERTGKILDSGVPVLQFRDKIPVHNLRHDRASALKELCAAYQTIFIINDDVRLAAEIQADGVHIGQDDMSVQETRGLLGDKAIIGVSCYNDFRNAITAQETGADYIAFGAFYSTQTKTKTVIADIALLDRSRKELTVPVVAIGGINPENGKKLIRAGADMLAVISCLYDEDNPQTIVKRFKQLFDECGNTE